MAIDLDQIREHYSKMDEAKLIRIAKFDIGSLEEEVELIVIAEIRKRGLDENLLKGIKAQTKDLSEEDVGELIDKIRKLDCPECEESNRELVGGIIRKVRSYLIITQYEVRSMIACENCVEIERKNQLIKNSLLGWWGIPWGLLYRTPQAIIGHFKDGLNRDEISQNILKEFAIQNVGELKTNWENEDELVDFINRQNRMKN